VGRLDARAASCDPSGMVNVRPQRAARVELFPAGTGLALVGAVLMIVGACGPWIGRTLFESRSGIALGGDGWLVVACAAAALLPLVLPSPKSTLKGFLAVALALGAAYVCWIHYQEANDDGFNVVWGLELSAMGSGLLLLAGFRLLKR
jgi:hypothetical protein